MTHVTFLHVLKKQAKQWHNEKHFRMTDKSEKQVFPCVCVVAGETIKFLQDTSDAKNDVSLEIAIFHLRSRF